jgi:glycosyltransferase involved in cell wall biosynthesis
MQDPVVSVVVPAYNAASTIRATLHSVLTQTLSELEVIVINDGSTDQTLDLIRDIQNRDHRLRVLSFPNSGPAASRNRGIAHSRAPCLSFVDADDLWTPDKLESQLRALEQGPETAVVYSWNDYIDENGMFLYPGSHATLSGDVYAELLQWNFIENGSNVLVRRDVFEHVGVFDESLAAAEDRDFLIRAARRYPFAVVPKTQILYRVAARSRSSNIKRQEQVRLEVIRRNFAQAPASLQPLLGRSLSNTYTYLTMRALDSSTSRERSLMAVHCLRKAVAYDRSLIVRKPRLLAVIGVKVALAALLPRGSTKLLSALRRIVHRRPSVPAATG